MKKLLPLIIAAIFSLLLCPAVVDADAAPAKLHGPKVGIEDAIRMAKDLVQKQNLRVDDSCIDSTRLEQTL
jgi:hypothetical protein